jgi:saccharopine dehydrogenase-like NADP-dependent oxidoreductase
MKVIILGCGKIGSVLAKDFISRSKKSAVTVSDIDPAIARKLAKEIGAEWYNLDASEYDVMVEKMKEFDLVLGALPGDFGFNSIRASIEAGVNMIDVSFTSENPLKLMDSAKKSNSIIIPDCGVAPGISNILVGYSTSMLSEIEEARILVGGIPKISVPPLDYTITWSADGLIDEYIREVTIIKNQKKVMVPPLSGLEIIDFKGVGALEAFYTDGLRTLIHSYPEIENMYEKTLRYPGHVEKVKLLKDLGFFSDDPIAIGDKLVSPKFMTARILEKSLWKPEIEDLLALLIEVNGTYNGKKQGYRYRILDYYDRSKNVSAMARTTAYSASIIASMIADGTISEKGIYPPEKLGENQYLVKRLLTELKNTGIKIEETKIA